MSPTNHARDSFDEDFDATHSGHQESGWAEESDEEDEFVDDSLDEMLEQDSADDEWDSNEFDSEEDFYDEIRERFEHDDTD